MDDLLVELYALLLAIMGLANVLLMIETKLRKSSPQTFCDDALNG